MLPVNQDKIRAVSLKPEALAESRFREFKPQEEDNAAYLAKRRMTQMAHIQDTLFGKERDITYDIQEHEGTGMLVTEMLEMLDRNVELPWRRQKEDRRFSTVASTRTSSLPQLASLRTANKARMRRGQMRQGSFADPEVREQQLRRRFSDMVRDSGKDKLVFEDIHNKNKMLPGWAVTRIETACRSARYELPAELSLLEDMTPLQFLANYVRLYREQYKRYAKIFKKFKAPYGDTVKFDRLHDAINTLFQGCLNKDNFDLMCIALLIDSRTEFDELTFIGLCTLADRLYWSAYIDLNELCNYGVARTMLECVDFDNLQWKLRGLRLSEPIRYLLRTLAL